MKRVLVTGGAGFIGANFVYYWQGRYSDDFILVLDALTYAGNLASLKQAMVSPNFRFVHGDICNRELVEFLLEEYRIDTIVNFAAESHVDRSISGPDQFIKTNIQGTHALLEAARAAWLKPGLSSPPAHRFHHVSTDEVYGSLGPDDPPFSETTPYAPNSPYSASKAASDHLVRAYHHTYGLDVTTSNCSNNYGPFQFPEKLIPLIIINILYGKPLPIYGDGKNIRDWLHVEDHCRGIDLVIRKGAAGEVYNIGGCNEWTNIDIVHLVCRHVDQAVAGDPKLSQSFPDTPAARGSTSESLITFVSDRPGHDRRYAIDPEKSKRELGYSPAVTFEQGIKSTVNWYLQNQQWWKDVLDGSYRQWIEKQYRDLSQKPVKEEYK